MCNVKTQCGSSHAFYVLYVTCIALHCPTMRNYYCKLSTGARKIYDTCTGSQLPVFTVKSMGSFYSDICDLGFYSTRSLTH